MDIEIGTAIALNLRARRTASGLSRDEVCDRLREQTGIALTAPTLGDYEAGRSIPRADTLCALALVLGLPVGALLTPAPGLGGLDAEVSGWRAERGTAATMAEVLHGPLAPPATAGERLSRLELRMRALLRDDDIGDTGDAP